MEIQRRSPVKIHVMIPMRRRRDCRVESRPNPDRIPADSDADFRDRFRIDSGAIPGRFRINPGPIPGRCRVGAESARTRSRVDLRGRLLRRFPVRFPARSAPDPRRARIGPATGPHRVRTRSIPGPHQVRAGTVPISRAAAGAFAQHGYPIVIFQSPAGHHSMR